MDSTATVPPRLVRLRNVVRPALDEHLGPDAYTAHEYRDELSLTVPRERIVETLRFLRDDPRLRFDSLRDICVVDWNRRRGRFEVVYNIFSMPNAMRIRVKCLVEERDPHVESAVAVYPAANWYEREAYDMHGVIFDGHPDLRRMYMPEDFVHPETGEPLYPLRKDFPMMGIPGSLPLPPKNG